MTEQKKFKKIGLYFGSFNPMHQGHCHVIKKALQTTIDKLYIVVSPQSPFKPLSELAPFKDRLEMARLTIKENGWENKVEAVDWEEHMYPSYTAHTLREAVPMLKDNDVVIFMGLDNFMSIEKWKELDYILSEYSIYIIPRECDDTSKIVNKKIEELKHIVTPNIKSVSYSNPMEMFDMSATQIRVKIQNNESIDDMLSKSVVNYIKDNNLYQMQSNKKLEI